MCHFLFSRIKSGGLMRYWCINNSLILKVVLGFDISVGETLVETNLRAKIEYNDI